MSTLKFIEGSVSIQADDDKKYRVSAGSPIPAVFWVSREEMIALRDCITKMLECDD